jgi:hypothetical protein
MKTANVVSLITRERPVNNLSPLVDVPRNLLFGEIGIRWEQPTDWGKYEAIDLGVEPALKAGWRAATALAAPRLRKALQVHEHSTAGHVLGCDARGGARRGRAAA